MSLKDFQQNDFYFLTFSSSFGGDFKSLRTCIIAIESQGKHYVRFSRFWSNFYPWKVIDFTSFTWGSWGGPSALPFSKTTYSSNPLLYFFGYTRDQIDAQQSANLIQDHREQHSELQNRKVNPTKIQHFFLFEKFSSLLSGTIF